INTYYSTTLRRPLVDEGLYTRADSVGVAFWLSYCRMLHNMSLKGDVIDHYCPNPCRNNPCVDMAYTMTDNCEVYLDGMYDKDFKCTCIETATWSFSKRACVIYDRCKLTEQGRLPTGNQACNVDAGGECLPVIGTDLFVCQCKNGWLIDTGGRRAGSVEGRDPNCQLRHDPCMSLPCEVGDCVSSRGEAICQCPATHYGPKCQFRRGLWSVWGPWSSCDPDCGDRRERHRSRCVVIEVIFFKAVTFLRLFLILGQPPRFRKSS
uniref:EGF-like domain-containing protein n=2 Tax=Macrostomum lignano TaxID=282301 RepID=A0A1I8IR78_9PLAT